MKDRDPVRAAVHYRGNVQGVGFRATAASQVHNATVVGWVRNEPDGSVRLEAEGTRAEVEQFLERIGQAMAGRIEDQYVQWLEPLGNEREFRIRY